MMRPPADLGDPASGNENLTQRFTKYFKMIQLFRMINHFSHFAKKEQI